MSGPLAGHRVLELGGIGPVPFAGMVLGDLGATVVRIEPPSGAGLGADSLARGKHIVRIDAKDPQGSALVRELACMADIFLEGFRPGVVERLGLGPEELCAANERLIYVRTTGFGQHGPLAERAGHDITYLAIGGALGAMGSADAPPLPPLNLLADFGSGGMLSVVGALAGLIERERTGRGRVVDAAMVDGVLLTETMVLAMVRGGSWQPVREANLLDGGAPFYRTYRCADDRWIAVGALEPQFFHALLRELGLLERFDPADQYDRARWDELAALLGAAFGSAPRAVWEERFAGLDACVAPVLGLDELATAPQHVARRSFIEVAGHSEPAPAPRFEGDTVTSRPGPSRDAVAALVAAGLEPERARDVVGLGLVR